MAKAKAKAPKGKATSEKGELLGGVYHAGKHFSRKNPAAFAAAVENGEFTEEQLQHLANAGTITGYGTSASEAKKAAKSAEEGEE